MTHIEQLRHFLEHTASAESERRKNAEPAPLPEKPVPDGSVLQPLPEPELLQDQHVNFLELVELRTTQRQYSSQPLTLQELSYLLWCTQGVKMPLANGGSMRTVPSAGARHALETYLYIRRVEGLQPGLYRFLAFEHALVQMEAVSEEQFFEAFSKRPVVLGSAVTFLWAAEADRMLYQFGARGIRYLYLDAGHVCENLYLAAESLHIGACALGSFDDEKLNAVLELEEDAGEFIVYAAAVGKLT